MSKCTHCLATVPTEEFLANDHVCANCASQPASYPLSSPSHFTVYCPVADGLVHNADTPEPCDGELHGLASASVHSPFGNVEEGVGGWVGE